MKKQFCSLLLLLALLALFTSCSRTASFSIEQGGYRDQKTGVLYVQASDNYRSTSYYEDELVGTYRNPKSGKITTFYRVAGIDGVLSDQEFQLYVAEGVPLPALCDLSLDSADLCRSDTITFSIRTFDADRAKQLRDSVLNGASFDKKLIDENLLGDWYELVFSASQISISYRLFYQELTEELLVIEPLTDEGAIPDLYPGIPVEKAVVNGKNSAVFHFGTQFLYDRSTQTYYPIENLTSESAS